MLNFVFLTPHSSTIRTMALNLDFSIEELMRVAAAEGWPWHPGWNVTLSPEDVNQAGGHEINSEGKFNSVKQINEPHSRNHLP